MVVAMAIVERRKFFWIDKITNLLLPKRGYVVCIIPNAKVEKSSSGSSRIILVTSIRYLMEALMEWNALLTYLGKNLEVILAIVTIISFIGNIVQRKTNSDAQYVFESIFQACNRTRIDHFSKKKKSMDELLTIILLLRIQASSGLRLLGSTMDFDPNHGYQKSYLWGWFANIYRLLLRIRRKLPSLLTGKNTPTPDSIEDLTQSKTDS